jgi:hypothetical protein
MVKSLMPYGSQFLAAGAYDLYDAGEAKFAVVHVDGSHAKL